MSEELTDAEKLHRVKLMAQGWYDEQEADIWWYGEEILKIIDPGNPRLQPPPPPTEEEIAARREQERQWAERRRQEALDREAAMLARYQRGIGAILENWDIDENGLATRKKPSD